MSVIKLPHGDGTWETLKIPNIAAAITPEHDTYNTFNIGFDNTTVWKSITTPYTYKPADMTQSSGNIPIYMPYEGSINTGIQVVYGTVGTDIGKIWMRRCDAGTWADWALVAGGGAVVGDTLPIGSQVSFGSLTIPDNWLLCDGSAISRVDYSELFAVIGTSYGAGDGTTTFNLPNKKGRTSVGYDASQTEFNTIGKIGGHKDMQQHYHLQYFTSQYGYRYPLVGLNGVGGKVEGAYNTGSVQSTTRPQIHSGNAGTGDSGNLQPYETDHYIIKAKQSAGVVATVVDDLLSDSPINALSSNMGRVLKEKVEGTVLYDDTTGTNGTITLSETSANFTYLEIFYRNIDSHYGSIKVYNPNGKIANLNIFNGNGSSLWVKSNQASISGTSITISKAVDFNITANIYTAGNSIYITRVVGYK